MFMNTHLAPLSMTRVYIPLATLGHHPAYDSANIYIQRNGQMKTFDKSHQNNGGWPP
jgi:hypothetical protein